MLGVDVKQYILIVDLCEEHELLSSRLTGIDSMVQILNISSRSISICQDSCLANLCEWDCIIRDC